MSRSIRYAVLVPLSVLAFFALFVLPGIDLGWFGGLAMFAAAWLVWYLLWATLRESAAAAQSDESATPTASPGEQRAWIGLVFSFAILVYLGLRGPLLVAADGSLARGASAIGRHLGFLIAVWLVAMQVLRKRWRDSVELDERDRVIHARAVDWARGGLSVFVIGVAVTFAFTPLERLDWAQPMVISNLMMAGLIASCVLEYAVTALSYWMDRR